MLFGVNLRSGVCVIQIMKTGFRRGRRLQMPNKKHGGKRTGAGRKSAFLPLHAKKLRSTDKEWEEFLSYLTGDATVDFEILLQALMEWRNSGGVHVSEIDGDGTANKA